MSGGTFRSMPRSTSWRTRDDRPVSSLHGGSGGMGGDERRLHRRGAAAVRAVRSALRDRKCARLADRLVFKGGNALDLVWQPNRSTIDLDFSLDMDGATFAASAPRIRESLGQGLRVASNRIGIRYAVHSVKPEIPKPHQTFITYTAKVGYVLPDDQRVLDRLARNPHQYSSQALPIEISINEPICDSTFVTIDPAYPQIRVSTLEDIVGEKPRALLRQPIRGRGRRQDLLDIAVIVQGSATLDRSQVAAFNQGGCSRGARLEGGVSGSGGRRAGAGGLCGVGGNDADGLSSVRRRVGNRPHPGERIVHPRRVRESRQAISAGSA